MGLGVFLLLELGVRGQFGGLVCLGNANKHSHMPSAHAADEAVSLNTAGGAHRLHPGGTQVPTWASLALTRAYLILRSHSMRAKPNLFLATRAPHHLLTFFKSQNCLNKTKDRGREREREELCYFCLDTSRSRYMLVALNGNSSLLPLPR